MRRRLLPVALAVAAGACTTPAPGPQVPDEAPARTERRVIVSSFDFPESELLGELYAGALERAGIDVHRELLLGSREVVTPALEQGLVDVLPEYLGTALVALEPEAEASTEVDEARERLVEAYRPLGVAVLEPSAAEDENAVVVTTNTALVHGLRTTSDLADFDDAFRFGGPAECPRRPFCLLGLEQVYDLRFGEFVPLDTGGPLTVAALRGDEVDVGLLFSTDPNLAEGGDLVALDDDRSLQPAENVTPAVRREVLEREGDRLTDALHAVSAGLTTAGLRRLNRQVVLDGREPAEVAAAWLAERGAG
ncbi:ABC transporter substrate-binding protein [soil metagenome]|nr:ABC transporter substrate-binding protein [Acidimicrobiia bacterium]